MEIYKETAYDLLPTTGVSTNVITNESFNEQKTSNKTLILPIIQILESSSDEYGGIGQLILRNINVYDVMNEQEALSLYRIAIQPQPQ